MIAFMTPLLGIALSAMAARPWPSRPVELNTATRTELMQLPGIGQQTAERIILFRKQHGSFQRLEELMDVQGIGEKTFARLRPHLVLGRAGQGPRHP